jgi:hypothetical protein
MDGAPLQLQQCLKRAAAEEPCPVRRAGSEQQRKIPVQILIDERYTSQWPNWQVRLTKTFACVHLIYAKTPLVWSPVKLTLWQPGDQRHDLHALLRRVQGEYQRRSDTITVGLTVWDERRVFARIGGEIGLSQGGACVVPSWPRIENDCLTLAHEFGHLAGAKHVPGENWLMSSNAITVFRLPARDAVERAYNSHRIHPRNLAAFEAYRSAQLTRHGLQPSASCARYLRRIDQCWGL